MTEWLFDGDHFANLVFGLLGAFVCALVLARLTGE